MIKVNYPWKMIGRYSDDHEAVVAGGSEEHCMAKLIDLIPAHGDLTWYSGYGDEDYVDGEYVGRDNFIYD